MSFQSELLARAKKLERKKRVEAEKQRLKKEYEKLDQVASGEIKKPKQEVFEFVELLICGFLKGVKFSSPSPVPKEIIYIIGKFYQLVTVIIQNGSGTIKAGFSKDNAPISIFPTIVGRERNLGSDKTDRKEEICMIGHGAIKNRGILSIKYPVEHGIITSFDDIEKIWHHTFKTELIGDSTDCDVLLTEKANNPKANREKITQIMFETFKVKGLYIAIDAVLSLYATGKVTGIVAQIGDGVGHTVPIYEGYAIPHAVERLDMGGRDMNDYLAKIMTERGYGWTPTFTKKDLHCMKEKLCYVALDFDEELIKSETSSDLEMNYELPDGQVIIVGAERFRAGEILFKPSLIGLECDGIHKLIYSSIMKCDRDIRQELHENMVLSGGVCCLSGIDERIEKESIALAPARFNPKIVNSTVDDREMRKYLSWIGGSIVASQTGFQELLITRDEYEQDGPSIVNRKCF